MAPTFDKDYVLKTVEERDVHFVRFWFTDVLGMLKSFAVTDTELEGAFEEGMGFDGSSIDGFTRLEESDMVAFPNPETFQILPWRPAEQGVGRMFCDIIKPDGTPFEGDPRYALKRITEKAADMGYTMYVGPELEFFYFADDQDTEVLDKGGYFDLTPLDIASDLRRDTVLTLEKMGIPVEYSHHEVAPSQHEIDLRYSDALTMADNVMTYRLVVKEIACRTACTPRSCRSRSSVRTARACTCTSRCSPRTATRSSTPTIPRASTSRRSRKHYIAGLLKYAPEFCAVTNPLVNSYKRLVPGYEAPVYIAWARRNRSALVRVPMYKPGKENATRLELRSPDPSANPYLAFAVHARRRPEGYRGEAAARARGHEQHLPHDATTSSRPPASTRCRAPRRGDRPLRELRSS